MASGPAPKPRTLLPTPRTAPDDGELFFQKPQLLEQHLTVKHAVSELYDEDSGKSVGDLAACGVWFGVHDGRRGEGSSGLSSCEREKKKLIKGSGPSGFRSCEIERRRNRFGAVWVELVREREKKKSIEEE